MAEEKDTRKSTVEFDSSWVGILTEMDQWQRKQFPATTPYSCAAHLHKESLEIVNGEMNHEATAEEWADAFHLVIQGGVKAAGSLDEFREHVHRKLWHNINERQWQAPDKDGVVEHVRLPHQHTQPRPCAWVDEDEICTNERVPGSIFCTQHQVVEL